MTVGRKLIGSGIGPVTKKTWLLACALVALTASARDRAVLVYPQERAFFRPLFYSFHQRQLVKTLRTQYDVEIHEQVATANDLFAIDVRGASLLVISGHGNPFSIGLEDRDARTIDATHRAKLDAFFAQLAPDATIVLQSCDTGRGFAWLVKEAAGPTRRVIAAKGRIPRDGLALSSLAPLDVKITCDDGAGKWDCTLRL
jgi:hypothetical protein